MNPQQIIRWGRYFCGLSGFFAALAVGFFSHGDIVGALVSLFWLELHRADEFARRGEQEARKHLDKIWQIVNE